MVSLLATAYVTVLVAELVGDKTLYTLGALGARFRIAPVLAGAVLAFMIKMLVAVLLGGVLATLPPLLVRAVSAGTFFAMAVALWLKRSKPAPAEPATPPRWSHAAGISFAAIFFPEWGDPGQLAAAMLVAQHRAPVVVWSGAMLAMITKAVFSATLGIGLRRWAPGRAVRIVSVVMCVAMGLLAAFGIET